MASSENSSPPETVTYQLDDHEQDGLESSDSIVDKQLTTDVFNKQTVIGDTVDNSLPKSSINRESCREKKSVDSAIEKMEVDDERSDRVMQVGEEKSVREMQTGDEKSVGEMQTGDEKSVGEMQVANEKFVDNQKSVREMLIDNGKSDDEKSSLPTGHVETAADNSKTNSATKETQIVEVGSPSEILQDVKTLVEKSANNKKPNFIDNVTTDSKSETTEIEIKSMDKKSVKIKLRSFASLCTTTEAVEGTIPSEIKDVAIGDIVEHGNIVTADEDGGVHLKITNVLGQVDCITGVPVVDAEALTQVSSVSSLMEPSAPENLKKDESSKDPQMDLSLLKIVQFGSLSGSSPEKAMPESETADNSVSIVKIPMRVVNVCSYCQQRKICTFSVYYQKPNSEHQNSFLCSESCKTSFEKFLGSDLVITKSKEYIFKICGQCGVDLSNKCKDEILTWQTKEFCNRDCLADHVGEVAKTCSACQKSVAVLHMVKYCVRFGCNVYQFCSKLCLQDFKSTVQFCAYCQKNLASSERLFSTRNKNVYCSSKCIKRGGLVDIGQQSYKIREKCTVCEKLSINNFEFINNNTVGALLCSKPCLSAYKYVNNLTSINCCLCNRFLNAEDFPLHFFQGDEVRAFCSDSCKSVYIISTRKIEPCNYCKVKKYNYDMIGQHLTGRQMHYCSICCFVFIDASLRSPSLAVTDGETDSPMDFSDQTTTNSIVPRECNMCTKVKPPKFHMVMADSTLRSFCCFECANKFKVTFGFSVSGSMRQNGIASEIDSSASQNTSPLPSEKPILEALKQLEPKMVCNKATSCSSMQVSTSDMSTQTEDDGKPFFAPIPLPVFVPTPMMMYSANVPVPLFIPFPVPVPVFIPTTEKTTQDIEKRMKAILEEIPSNPEEAEVLLLARQEAEKANIDTNGSSDDVTLKVSLNEPSIMPQDCQDNEPASQISNCGKRKQSCLDDEQAPSPKKQKQDSNDESTEQLKVAPALESWHQWVANRNKDSKARSITASLFDENLLDNNAEKLNQSLSMFLNELRRPDGQHYRIDRIFYLLLGLQKDLSQNGSTKCIFLEDDFEKFISVFDKVIRMSVGKMLESDITCFLQLHDSCVTEEMLWESKQLGAHTPHVLVFTLFYFNTKYFHMKTVQSHLGLKTSCIVQQWKKTILPGEASYNRASMLTLANNILKDDSDLEQTFQMIENSANPMRCPVKLYEFYLSKCTDEFRAKRDMFYVNPEKCCLPDSPVWFSTEPLSFLTLQRMLHRVFLVKDVQACLFNQSGQNVS